MVKVLEIGAVVATPLGLLGFVAGLAYFVRARQLKYKEVALEKLSPEERSRFLDENLSRYKIDAANATREQKFQLIKDEMEKRYRLAILYTLISAFVVIACFGLAVYGFAFVRPGDPTDRKATRYQVIDSLTKDRIYRPLSVIYQIQGSSEEKPENLSEHNRGQFQLDGEAAVIEIRDVKCPGYTFVRKTANQQDNIFDLELKRVVKGKGEHTEFLDAIKPRNVPFVADQTFRNAIKDQKVPRGNMITLNINNNSKYHVNILLYRQADGPYGNQWIMPPSPFPRNDKKEYVLSEPGKGA